MEAVTATVAGILSDGGQDPNPDEACCEEEESVPRLPEAVTKTVDSADGDDNDDDDDDDASGFPETVTITVSGMVLGKLFGCDEP